MHLQRVRVPDFRVLKDVDITFEKEFFPRIFPLGSLNGGGKSTLLQLIFVLLHCPCHPERLPFLKNMLSGFGGCAESETKQLAEIEIFDESLKKKVTLNFFICRELCCRKILSFENSIAKENSSISENINENDFDEYNMAQTQFLEAIEYFHEIEKHNSLNDSIELKKARGILEAQRQRYELFRERMLAKTISHKLIYICPFLSNHTSEEKSFLLCQFDRLNTDEVNPFLEDLSQKTFFAAPSTQVFLFLSHESKKKLFKAVQDSSYKGYFSQLDLANLVLPGLLVYHFFTIDLIIDSFLNARDKDFKKVLETGSYGNSYQTLLNELNFMLGDKKINLESDLSGVTFKLEQNDEEIDLYPEDLSHGELKRLSLYLWLKFKNIENAIVLIDEIEIALHPDWQYQIVSDLQEWGPSNQYILATHSYELCQALTPAHIKELEPRLIKQKPDSIPQN